MAESTLIRGVQMDKPLRDLIEMMHFVESVSGKIHGVLDEAEIYKVVKEEFAKSEWYNVSVFLLTDAAAKLKMVATSLSPRKTKAGERTIGVGSYKSYSFDLERSRFFTQVVKEGKTIEANFADVAAEYFPRPLAYLTTKVIGYDRRSGILTPLKRHGKIVGMLVVDSVELSEFFIPSVKSLAQHISTALELAREHAERGRIEKELTRERDLLQDLMDNIPDAIYFKDANLRFTRINRAHAERIELKDPKEAIGKTVFDFYPTEYAQEAFSDEQEIVRTGQPLIDKIQEIKMKDGRLRWTSITKVPIKDKDGQVTGLVGISRDITERKQMEEELRRYSEHLEELVEEGTLRLKEAERMAAIGETAAMVGHDLRNPLQVIVNTLYLVKKMLKSPVPSGTTLRDDLALGGLLRMVGEQVEYMNKIVSDLQEYARPVQPELVPVNLSQIVHDVLSVISIPRNVQASIVIEDNLPRLTVDPSLIKRVFVNLVTNALQAMPAGGRLTIRASRTEEEAHINVRDTGVGIPQENIDRLFQPLFTTKARGQGFGLAVCKRLVEAHGGSITAESRAGEGSTFTVKLPLREGAGGLN